MAKRHVDDGIAGGRTVTLEIKIPNGRNCLKCPAHSKKFGSFWTWQALRYLWGA